MTRFYASIALVALVLLAAPKIQQGWRMTEAVADHAARASISSLLDGETPDQIGADVVGCIASDISRGETR